MNLSLGHLLLAALARPFTLLGVLLRRPPLGPSACQAAGFLDTFLASRSALSADQRLAGGFPLHHGQRLPLHDARLLPAYPWGQIVGLHFAALPCSWLGCSGAFVARVLRPLPVPELLRFAAVTVALRATGFALPLAVPSLALLKAVPTHPRPHQAGAPAALGLHPR